MTGATPVGDDTQARTCELCGAPILRAEIDCGAAIRVGTELLCPNCVEQLPVNAKIRINQLRALHGMQATTYRLVRNAHPRLGCFTFSTSVQLLQHHRLRRRGRELEAPLIGSRQAGQPQDRVAVGSGSRRRQRLLSGAAGAALLLLISLIIVVLRGGPTDPTVDSAPPPVPAVIPAPVVGPEPVVIHRQRGDYPADPFAAFPGAAAELGPGNPVLKGIADEVLAQRGSQLDLVRAALGAGELVRAADLLDRVRLPDHPLLTAVTRQELALRQELERLQQAASTRPEPPPVREPEPPPPPPAAALRWATPVTALLAGLPPPTGWQERDGALVLDGISGSLSRLLVLPEGDWQAWLEVSGPAPRHGSLNLMLGSGTLTPATALDASNGRRWLPLTAQSVQAGGEVPLTLTAQGSGWTLHSLVLGEAGAAMPGDEGPAELPDPDWVAPVAAPEPQPPPVEEAIEEEAPAGPPPGTRRPLELTTAWPQTASFLEMQGSTGLFARAGATLPGNAGPWLAVSRHDKLAGLRRKTSHLILEFGTADLGDGGVSLLLHPIRPDRKQLGLRLEDADGRILPLPDLNFPDSEWARFHIPLPAGIDPQRFAVDRVTRLVLYDLDEKITTAFVLGKAVLFGDRPPTAGDLDLEVRPLLAPSDRDLAKLVHAVTAVRRLPHWERDFQPRSLRILLGDPLYAPGWVTALRKELQPLFEGRPPNGTVDELVLHDAWLDDAFIIPRELLDADLHQIMVVATGGGEFRIGLDIERAVGNFYLKMVREAMRSGMLPVVVLGPDKAGEAFRAEMALLWARVVEEVRAVDPGIPIIDLRSVAVTTSGRYAHGQAQRCAELLGGACLELVARIERIQQVAQDAKR